jgi:hypothetical protein
LCRLPDEYRSECGQGRERPRGAVDGRKHGREAGRKERGRAKAQAQQIREGVQPDNPRRTKAELLPSLDGRATGHPPRHGGVSVEAVLSADREGLPGIHREPALFLVRKPVDQPREGRDPGFDQGDPPLRSEHARRVAEEIGWPCEVVEHIEPHNNVQAACGEWESAGVGGECIPGGRVNVRRDPVQVVPTSSGRVPQEAWAGTHLQDPRAMWGGGKEGREPRLVDTREDGLTTPKPAVLKEAFEAHDNASAWAQLDLFRPQDHIAAADAATEASDRAAPTDTLHGL